MSDIIGRATFASGERQIFTDPAEFLKTIREELPDRSSSGFAYEVLTTDPKTRKAVDDLVYNEVGEKNPHDLAFYESAQRNIPIYQNTGSHANKYGELEQYRASYKANVACKEAIETAISDNYRNDCLDPACVKQVVREFGYDRMLYVLANTVRHKDWDGRISRENKDWAKTIPVCENPDGFGGDRNVYFVVDRSHPGLTDLFVTQARKSYLLTQPLTKEDVQKEAEKLLSRFQSEDRPNSPSGTHYMAQISQDFLQRASSKDMDSLLDRMPFRSACFTNLKDRKGLFAVISADEDRFQPLRQPKSSVREKLQKNPTAAKLPVPGKSKEQER